MVQPLKGQLFLPASQSHDVWVSNPTQHYFFPVQPVERWRRMSRKSWLVHVTVSCWVSLVQAKRWMFLFCRGLMIYGSSIRLMIQQQRQCWDVWGRRWVLMPMWREQNGRFDVWRWDGWDGWWVGMLDAGNCRLLSFASEWRPSNVHLFCCTLHPFSIVWDRSDNRSSRTGSTYTSLYISILNGWYLYMVIMTCISYQYQ